MKHRAAAPPRKIQQFRLALHRSTRQVLRLGEQRERGLREQLPAQFQPGDDRLLIGLGGQVIRIHRRRVGRIGTLQRNLTPTVGT